MKTHSSNLQTLLGSFHADIWEVDEVLPYVQSLSDVDQMKLKKEMELLIDNETINSAFMRKFVSDEFKSNQHALAFVRAVFDAAFNGKDMPDIDKYIE